MKGYRIFRFDNSDIENVVFVTSTEDLYSLQSDIYNEISATHGKNFSVLVDLFLRNGFSYNRFVSLHFKGRNQCRSYIVSPGDVSEDIKLKIKQYLITHPLLLYKSALTKSTINFVVQCIQV